MPPFLQEILDLTSKQLNGTILSESVGNLKVTQSSKEINSGATNLSQQKSFVSLVCLRWSGKIHLQYVLTARVMKMVRSFHSWKVNISPNVSRRFRLGVSGSAINRFVGSPTAVDGPSFTITG
jgi:hypothetical protein